MRTDNAADIRLVAMLENSIFYISRMYEFSHSLDPKRTLEPFVSDAEIALGPKRTLTNSSSPISIYEYTAELERFDSDQGVTAPLVQFFS
jgi:hypothetical protein